MHEVTAVLHTYILLLYCHSEVMQLLCIAALLLSAVAAKPDSWKSWQNRPKLDADSKGGRNGPPKDGQYVKLIYNTTEPNKVSIEFGVLKPRKSIQKKITSNFKRKKPTTTLYNYKFDQPTLETIMDFSSEKSLI
ncbi:hypothetical protein EPR50_G00017620 [Perca flavescens]|uniref:Uncharacterized protein n=1 Tax=Perca flavescens TaxID=8167 RepID=A0A484DP38_PERFV|nr:hypothetical protein EPR50_G00017620 [Perca flavescens]